MTEHLLTEYRNKIFNFLEETAKLQGKDFVKELIYRFSVSQFRDVSSFRTPNKPIILKVFYEAHAELGTIFEEFAEKAISSGMSDKDINFALKKWFEDFWHID